ncbi:MAG: DUF4276 family protein [Symploca sp. SIO1B1]|nr:DUF4276 family protein [Symploca sp. SIO2D2]NER19502.1 DUF4276 family protein [Symploca sp. SIO1C2]NER97694.1 DUF4276 family protein [Symploca sp. SIO1B1]
MNQLRLRYTLLTDGSSDKALLPILTWLLEWHLVDYVIESEWADLNRLRRRPKNLSEKIKLSLELYPCDILFVHRDAEKEPRENRVSEISRAIKEVGKSVTVPVVCVVPVRMTEAWLLFDEIAIRKAAENLQEKQTLQLPKLAKVEQLPDPKNYLCQLLRQASGATGRNLKKFKAREREKIQRVAELIDDFSPLRTLWAFKALEDDLVKALQRQGWAG